MLVQVKDVKVKAYGLGCESLKPKTLGFRLFPSRWLKT